MFLKCVPGQTLTRTERSTIEFINRNPVAMRDMTIDDIAVGADVSTSTVSRAIRKCGFKNMAEARYRIAVDDNMKKKADFHNVVETLHIECMRTLENIDVVALYKLAKLIREAKRIQVIAGGITAYIAHEFVFQLQCQRYDAYVQEAVGNWERIGQLVEAGDLVIIISCQSGARIPGVAKASAAKGAKVAFVALIDDFEVERYCDAVLRGYTQLVTMNQPLSVTSRLGLSILTRAIIECLGTEQK